MATDLLNRPTYSFGEVDRLLLLRSGTARRWIDGYDRAGVGYPPVIRPERTGAEAVTWGEFVETRLLRVPGSRRDHHPAPPSGGAAARGVR